MPAAGAPQTWLTDIRARITVGDMIAAIAGFLARRQSARPMAGCGSERTVGGRTLAAIVVQVPAVSMDVWRGAGTALAIGEGASALERGQFEEVDDAALDTYRARPAAGEARSGIRYLSQRRPISSRFCETAEPGTEGMPVSLSRPPVGCVAPDSMRPARAVHIGPPRTSRGHAQLQHPVRPKRKPRSARGRARPRDLLSSSRDRHHRGRRRVARTDRAEWARQCRPGVIRGHFLNPRHIRRIGASG